jgi:hypothetical protein
MTREVIATCPVCEGELQVTHLRCTTCGTGIEGQFSVGRFGRLTREQMYLLESFLRARGNLRDMERELGISYPTIRNRVEGLVRALGLADGSVSTAPAPDTEPATAGQRRQILERLARHEITAEQAAAELRGEPAQMASPARAAAPAEPAPADEPAEPDMAAEPNTEAEPAEPVIEEPVND